ncbi:hypothetical protein P7M47_10345 [Bisgaard Taxon 10/6]|uniref:hypothetical protein n=1 Tax=Exercitatus varius TaxID=67857 RepID=UPI00294B7E44|nr:hypothetical protein [Exercitatus varius]MDG2916367.1 hypothetical protein [Exercitatus varius]
MNKSIVTLEKDTEIDGLLYLYQTEPEKLTEAQKSYLDRELKVIVATYFPNLLSESTKLEIVVLFRFISVQKAY